MEDITYNTQGVKSIVNQVNQKIVKEHNKELSLINQQLEQIKAGALFTVDGDAIIDNDGNYVV